MLPDFNAVLKCPYCRMEARLDNLRLLICPDVQQLP